MQEERKKNALISVAAKRAANLTKTRRLRSAGEGGLQN